MLHFENYYIFTFLILILVLIGIFMASRIRVAWLRQQFAENSLFQRLVPSYSEGRKTLKFVLTIAAATFLIIGLANLRAGTRTQKVQRQSVDVYLAIDISKSMLAQDLKPSRMERAQQFALKLLSSMAKGERVGVLTFAGEAVLQMPLTTDYSAAEIQIRNADPSVEITQGTAIAEAIEAIVRTQSNEKKQKQKALLIITDGENHEENAVAAAEQARTKGVATYIIGVGTEAGAPIPIQNESYSGFQLDKDGQVVQSKMNKALMQQVATAGGGTFFDISEQSADAILSQLFNAFAQLEKSEFEQQAYDDYDTYFFIFAGIALALLVLDYLLPYAKQPSKPV